jgi:hypothetical protein
MNIGQTYRLEIDTTPSATATYAKVQHEVTFNMNNTSDKIETSSKDTGKHKSYLKTLLDTTISCTARGENSPSGTNLNYADIYELWTLNHTETTHKGERRMRITEDGTSYIEFKAFVESIDQPYENNGLVEYTFALQITTLPDLV